MSELKAFNSERIYWAVEQVEREAGDIDTLHLDDSQFYLKSEADKVIADLEDGCSYWKTMAQKNASDNAVMARQRAEAFERESHHKYKRCLANARIAQDDWHLHNSFYAMGHQEFEKRKCDFYDKWHWRWLKIAEKFKDGK